MQDSSVEGRAVERRGCRERLSDPRLLPIAGLLIGALAVGGLAWRWSRRREPVPAAVRLDPALERRVDDELARFEES